ncbi:MAG: endosialidase [Lachnospiraceae bacterium]|nr:endosialidase [Lachnospiraceae bacterium]
MSVVSELIRKEDDGTVSFGDYSLSAKTKLDNFEIAGDVYKVKTFKEITKLERNGMFVYESVPGTTVTGLKVSENGESFTVEGENDAQITLELEENTDYNICIDGKEAGTFTTNLGGKLSVSVELENGKAVKVEVLKA